MDDLRVGQVLTVERVARGLNPSELAQKSGVPVDLLLAAEVGEALPLPYLRVLSAYFETPLSWFLRAPLPNVASRRRNSTPDHEVAIEMDKRLEIFAGDVKEMVDDQLIAPVAKFESGGVPRDHASAELLAMKVRKYAKVGHDPIPNIQGFAELFGMYSLVLPFGDIDCDGAMVEVEPGVSCAVVNSSLKSGRVRMTMAHELGHLIFGDVYDSGSDDVEKMVNSFGVYLLAPRAGVMRLWNDPAISFHPLRERAIFVAEKFGLSWSTVKVHLMHLGLVNSHLLSREDEESPFGDSNPDPSEFRALGLPESSFRSVNPSASPQFEAAVLADYVNGLATAARTVEILAGTVSVDLLPSAADSSDKSLHRVNP